MLTLSGSLRVFLAVEPCDMRKSFDSLHALVTGQLGEDPRSGAVFVFTNKSRNRIKLLHWDGTGLWVHAKRLEKGTFSWPNGNKYLGSWKNGKQNGQGIYFDKEDGSRKQGVWENGTRKKWISANEMLAAPTSPTKSPSKRNNK